MIELIVFIVLLISLLGIGLIVFPKIPVLVKLPETGKRIRKENLILFIYQDLAKRSKFFHFSFYESFLEKTLSRMRILTLKADNRTSGWLQRLRENSKERKKVARKK